MRRTLSYSVAGVLITLVAGCTRTIEWNEEVPLNTGETIWIHRSGSTTYGSSPGNPLEFGTQPNSTTRISFKYRGRDYAYTTDGTLQVLAIAPDGTPNLVISANDYPWQFRNNYYCTRPSYVQLRPDVSGQNWTWPEHVDTWLYGLPTNLLIGLPLRKSTPLRISNSDRAQHNVHAFLVGKHFREIDPSYQSRGCKRRV